MPAGAPPTGAAQVAAAGILVLFSVLGFIMGYVVTTLWYSEALQHLLRGNEDESEAPADTLVKPQPVRPAS